MQRNNERGIAIVLALFLMSAMSVLAASLMFLSQTETYASMNYRMMSQARYAGEAGVQKASDFLLDAHAVHRPERRQRDRSAEQLTTGTGVAGRPYTGRAGVLSADRRRSLQLPVGGGQTAFDALRRATLTAGNATLNYGAYATLIAMQEFDAYGGTQNVVQTWEITGVGALAGARRATVEVVAMVETPKVPANNYAAFATANTCGAMYFHGNVTIDSYDSTRSPGRTRREHGGRRRRRRHEREPADQRQRRRCRATSTRREPASAPARKAR